MAIATINPQSFEGRLTSRNGSTRSRRWEGTVVPAATSSMPVAARRAARARMMRRRRRSLAGLATLVGVIALAWPGSAFGGTTKYGVLTDTGQIGRWHSGVVYVVQPGDTITTIAKLVSPEHPELVRRALVASLRSDVVVPGERVVIP
ncbi:MAG: hypothetical protein KJS64_06740 [Acidobacteria bacterium]|nr:hypothetical protein [Acidobacteriota bacterium]